jgi:toxin ParE1/3/4
MILLTFNQDVSRDNPEAAGQVLNRVWDAVQLLADQPHTGRAGLVPGTRELVVTGTPVIVPYRVVENTVQILRVLHGKRKWPQRFSRGKKGRLRKD